MSNRHGSTGGMGGNATGGVQHTSVPEEPEVKKCTDGCAVHRLLGAVIDGLVAV